MASLQPIIRYDTRDIIDVGDICHATGQRSYGYLGRRTTAVMLDGGTRRPTLVIAPTRLHEALDAFPDIAIHPHSFVEAVGLQSSIGFQRWGVETQVVGGVTHILLPIELCWSPRQFPDAAADLVGRIRTRMLGFNPALEDALRAGRVQLRIRLCEPGSTSLRAII